MRIFVISFIFFFLLFFHILLFSKDRLVSLVFLNWRVLIFSYLVLLFLLILLGCLIHLRRYEIGRG
jgi:hypothetical protein